jgi:phage major head subunit gpT-like protein
MLVNGANLDSLRVGFKTSFQKGLGAAPSLYTRVATVVPSTAKEEKYGWLGKVPQVREWLGPRVVQNVQQYDYAIKTLTGGKPCRAAWPWCSSRAPPAT